MANGEILGRLRTVRDNRGRSWLIDPATRTRWEITGGGQLSAALNLTGQRGVEEVDTLLTGWNEGPTVVDLFGGPNGIERALAGLQALPTQLGGGTIPDPRGVTSAVGETFSPRPPRQQRTIPDAFAEMDRVLQSVGLGNLSPALREFVTSTNPTESQFLLWLREQPQFRDRFPALFELEQEGRQLIPGGGLQENVRAYLQYEEGARELFRRFDLPPGFYDQPEDFSRFITAGVSLNELQSRVREGFVRVQQAPAVVREFFEEQFGPSGASALAAFFLDPDRAETALLERVRIAETGGAAALQGFDVGRGFARRLTREAGIQSFQQASQGFQQAARLRPLTRETISERQDITERQAIEASFGTDFTADELLRRRLERRQAQFSGGGGAARTQGGIIGLGTAE